MGTGVPRRQLVLHVHRSEFQDTSTENVSATRDDILFEHLQTLTYLLRGG